MQSISSFLEQTLTRRTVLRYGAMAGVLAATSSLWPMRGHAAAFNAPEGADFVSVPRGNTPHHAIAEGYEVQIALRWGDPLVEGLPDFDPRNLTAAEQTKRIGYNNDFLAWIPLGKNRGLLHINHEYTNGWLMFAGLTMQNAAQNATPEQLRIEMAAQGFSMVEMEGNKPVVSSPFNRRVTATTPMKISGPAAGHPRLRTLKDPQGTSVLGTFANCAGGVTPWGTVLVSEENFDGYFYGRTQTLEQASHDRYTVGKQCFYGWYRIDPRFAVMREPNEPNRFGWVVEYDPRDPKSIPVKRTALGRFKHESATCALAKDGRVVVYSGDDDYFEYIYRFVSSEAVVVDATEQGDARSVGFGAVAPTKNNALDDGILHVAKFHADGRLEWIALEHGQNGLTPENGFHSQADVLIEARRAGDVVGATKMDRPEGIAVHPQTQTVYVSLTKNPHRTQTDAANPRKANRAGHILQMMPAGGDHGSDDFRWEIFTLAGDPESDTPHYRKRPGKRDWFGCPDNLAIDPKGRLWVATDGMADAYGYAEGFYLTAPDAAPRCLFRAPIGAEVTGPCFTPDGETLFLSVQHPGEEDGSTFDTPATRWPDFADAMPPRPAVVAIRKK